MKKSVKSLKDQRKLTKRFSWIVRAERRKATKMPLAGNCACK
jgi:hypothetical protein